MPDGGIHTLQLHSKETVQNNVRYLVQTLAKKVASLQVKKTIGFLFFSFKLFKMIFILFYVNKPGGIYKLCDVSTPLQSDVNKKKIFFD